MTKVTNLPFDTDDVREQAVVYITLSVDHGYTGEGEWPPQG